MAARVGRRELLDRMVAEVTPRALSRQRFMLEAFASQFRRDPAGFVSLEDLEEAVLQGLLRRYRARGLPPPQNLQAHLGNILDNLEKLRFKLKKWAEKNEVGVYILADPVKGWRLAVPNSEPLSPETTGEPQTPEGTGEISVTLPSPGAEAAQDPASAPEVLLGENQGAPSVAGASSPASGPWSSDAPSSDGISAPGMVLRQPAPSHRLLFGLLAGAAVVAGLVLRVALLHLRVWPPPLIGRVTMDGERITFYDASGHAFWSAPSRRFLARVLAEGGFHNEEALEKLPAEVFSCGKGYYEGRFCKALDVDGDGKPEALIAFPFGDDQGSLPGAFLVALTARGKPLWVVEATRGNLPPDPRFDDRWFYVLGVAEDLDGDGRVELTVAKHHHWEYPTALILLDGRTGRVKSEYWHAGFLEPYDATDINGDGVKEIIAAGLNNEGVIDTFGEAVYAAIDLVNTRLGSSPQKMGGRFEFKGIPVKGAVLYARLPPLDTTRVIGIYESVLRVVRAPGSFKLQVGYPVAFTRAGWSVCSDQERKTRTDCPPTPYEVLLDKRLEIKNFRPGDDYFALHRLFQQEGRILRSSDAMLADWPTRVLYWDGAHWVNHYTLAR